MNHHLVSLADHVIRRASRDQPADALLRQELKSQHGLPATDAALVSRAVFAYYRWLGWLDRNRPLPDQLSRALDLVAHFAASPASFPDAELLARAVPAWLKTEMTVSTPWLRALQSEPRLWLRARRGQGTALSNKLDGCRPFGDGELADALECRGAEDLFRTPEFHAGEFEVQDLSSQAVALACAPQPGQTWWDACAGEGGKTLHLSALMANKGLIWSSDRAAWRLQRLKRRAARAGVFNYRAAAWDGGPKLPTKTRFDGVLIDAPCTGVGTWQRNPHARWTTTPQDVRELSELQRKLLAHVAPALKPNGKLVYAVCTLTRSETTDVVAAFEHQFPDFNPLPLINPLAPSQPPSPQLRLWPQDHGANGMFIAAWLSH
jgi:16S rRNA (cytosine967-C5)-methyltransferase